MWTLIFEVYDNWTGKLIDSGTYKEVEHYLDDPGRYTVEYQMLIND